MLPPCFKLEKNAAVLIPVSGDIEVLDRTPGLASAQKMVEGYVEALAFERDGAQAQALFNEDGLLKDMVPNLRASEVVGCMLVGPVIILTGTRRWT